MDTQNTAKFLQRIELGATCGLVVLIKKSKRLSITLVVEYVYVIGGKYLKTSCKIWVKNLSISHLIVLTMMETTNQIIVDGPVEKCKQIIGGRECDVKFLQQDTPAWTSGDIDDVPEAGDNRGEG
jgi:hypothetical protein